MVGWSNVDITIFLLFSSGRHGDDALHHRLPVRGKVRTASIPEIIARVDLGWSSAGALSDQYYFH